MKAMKQGSVFVAALAASLATTAGCGDSVRPERIPDIEGSWSYSETVTLEHGTVSCNALGTLSLVQDFETFVGSFIRTLTCSGPQVPPSTRTESGSVPRGRVQTSSIEFRIGDCDYRGAVTTNFPRRLSGTSLCTRYEVTTASTAIGAGSWAAERVTSQTP